MTLNGEQVRVFDTKSLSVFELLGSAGFKTSQIMGHSGAGLKFILNGETKMLKGTAFIPAVITVNDKPAALTTKIKQGDSITLTPAVNGENAHAFIRDYADDISRVSVIFCGENAVAGKRAYANGKEVGKDYEIQPLDNIEIHDARTLGAFLMQYGGDTQTATVYVNGEEKNFTTKEFDLLAFLAQNPNHVFTKDELFKEIWDMDSIGDIATVTVHIKKIREKIEYDTSKPQYIETIWGVGYRFKV